MTHQICFSGNNYCPSIDSSINVKDLFLSLPKLVARVSQSVASIFGNFIKAAYHKIYYLSKKLYAICLNELSYRFPSRPPIDLSNILCRTINIAKKGVIWREEDLNKTKEFIQLLTSPDYAKNKGVAELSLENSNKLKEYAISTPFTNGMCLGSSLWVIKSLLQSGVNSEAELVQCLSHYRDGFPAEAAALQCLYEALAKYKPPLEEEEELKNILDKEQAKFQAEVTQATQELRLKQHWLGMLHKHQRVDITEAKRKALEERDGLVGQKKKAFTTRIVETHLYKRLTDKLNYVAPMIDLKFRKYPIEECHKSNFTNLLNHEDKTNEFNALENGYYHLVFRCGKDMHSIVYIKREFGSYFVDPNYGLIKCSSTNTPAEKLSELLKDYQVELSEDDQIGHFLQVYHYQ